MSSTAVHAGPPPDFFVADDPPPASEPIAPETPPSGLRLGNYVLGACIGRGAMASVHRAKHGVLDQEVAIKVLASSLLGNAEARQRFLREAQAVALINHPHVVAITDAGVSNDTPYLVMELLEGVDLQRHLDEHGPLSPQQLAALALPLIAALGAAHDAGVIHRDLKPGNIFLARGASGETVPKLLDFGISKFTRRLGEGDLAETAFNQLLGSPLYLPPEALHGSRELTPRSDQYSLGVVLYECVTGRPPFAREDLVVLLNAISEGSCTPPRQLRPDTPPALEQAILRAMSVDPAQRFADIRDLGRALLALADVRVQARWAHAFEQERTAPPPVQSLALAPLPPLPPSSPARGPSRRRRSGPSRPLLSLALLAGGITAGALAFRPRAPRPLVVQALPAESLASLGTPPPLAAPAAPYASARARAVGATAPVAPAPGRPAAAPPLLRAAGESSGAPEPARPKAQEARHSSRRDRLPGSPSGPGTETREELSAMFFPSEGSRERVSRTAPAATPIAAVNEAPFFD